MGRTKRKRRQKVVSNVFFDQFNIINLQRTMKLKFPNIKISYFAETGRGVKCKKKIKKGDVLIAIPLSQLITTKVNCFLFSTLEVGNLPSQLVLSLWLMYESHLKTNSNYFEYIDSLPELYTNLYFCTLDEMNLLPEFLRKEVEIQSNNLKEMYKKCLKLSNNKLCPHCETSLKNLFILEKFIWAWFTVNTRSVYFHDESGKNSLALAPLLDMFNHSNEASSNILIDFEEKLYTLSTLVEYEKHQQVFIKYGPHSNLKLLLEYGFLIPDNPHDFVEFTFQEVTESLKELTLDYGNITKTKYNLIKKNKLCQNITKSKEEYSWNFNSLAYILITKDQDVSLLQSKIYSNDFTSSESDLIKNLGKIMAFKKIQKYKQDFVKMQEIKNCSESFQLAKKLLKIYIAMLK